MDGWKGRRDQLLICYIRYKKNTYVGRYNKDSFNDSKGGFIRGGVGVVIRRRPSLIGVLEPTGTTELSSSRQEKSCMFDPSTSDVFIDIKIGRRGVILDLMSPLDSR